MLENHQSQKQKFVCRVWKLPAGSMMSQKLEIHIKTLYSSYFSDHLPFSRQKSEYHKRERPYKYNINEQ